MNDVKIIKEKVRSLSVLLVDDEDLILNKMSTFLRKFFDQVDTADNGETALEKFKKDGPYDIVLSDIKMPRMSGNELIEEIKKIDKNVFTLIMSGSTEDVKESDIYDICYKKPISIDNIMNFLNMLIAKRKL